MNWRDVMTFTVFTVVLIVLAVLVLPEFIGVGNTILVCAVFFLMGGAFALWDGDLTRKVVRYFVTLGVLSALGIAMPLLGLVKFYGYQLRDGIGGAEAQVGVLTLTCEKPGHTEVPVGFRVYNGAQVVFWQVTEAGSYSRYFPTNAEEWSARLPLNYRGHPVRYQTREGTRVLANVDDPTIGGAMDLDAKNHPRTWGVGGVPVVVQDLFSFRAKPEKLKYDCPYGSTGEQWALGYAVIPHNGKLHRGNTKEIPLGELTAAPSGMSIAQGVP